MNEIQTIIQQSENVINSSGIVLDNQHIITYYSDITKHSEVDFEMEFRSLIQKLFNISM